MLMYFLLDADERGKGWACGGDGMQKCLFLKDEKIQEGIPTKQTFFVTINYKKTDTTISSLLFSVRGAKNWSLTDNK